MTEERTCYIGNLPEEITEDLIKELFIQVGPVEKVVLKNQEKYKYSLVQFEDEESVPFAIEMMDGIKLMNTAIQVKPRNNTKQEENYRRGLKRRHSVVETTTPSVPLVSNPPVTQISIGQLPSSFVSPSSYPMAQAVPIPVPIMVTPDRSKVGYKIPSRPTGDMWHAPPGSKFASAPSGLNLMGGQHVPFDDFGQTPRSHYDRDQRDFRNWDQRGGQSNWRGQQRGSQRYENRSQSQYRDQRSDRRHHPYGRGGRR